MRSSNYKVIAAFDHLGAAPKFMSNARRGSDDDEFFVQQRVRSNTEHIDQ